MLAPSLPQPLYRAQQVRDCEGQAAEKMGLSLYQLMEAAGTEAFAQLQSHFPQTHKLLVLAGAGNNGGDAYVLARLAIERGMSVTLCSSCDASSLNGDALQAQRAWRVAGGEYRVFSELNPQDFDVIVDGLLGTGISRALTQPYLDIVQRVNHSNVAVLSLDLPSGLHPDTGVAMGTAICATLTVTFVAIKTGLVSGQGKGCVGKLHLAELGIGQAFAKLTQPQAWLQPWQSLPALPKRAAHSYKGHYGKVLCVGGNRGMSGAIRLSAEGALRTGAGLVRVYCHASSVAMVGAGRPELMVQAEHLTQAVEWADVIVIGPGMGLDDWAHSCFEQVRQHVNKPVVFDADALTLLSQQTDKALHNAVLTPHAGEAARLLDCHWQRVEQDRYAAARQLGQRYHACTVLKGAGSIMYTQDGQTYVCPHGNPGMASGGMGDLLTGVLAGLLAQGLSLSDALLYGVLLHSVAADRVAESMGQRGMIASDLLVWLPQLVNAFDEFANPSQ